MLCKEFVHMKCGIFSFENPYIFILVNYCGALVTWDSLYFLYFWLMTHDILPCAVSLHTISKILFLIRKYHNDAAVLCFGHDLRPLFFLLALQHSCSWKHDDCFSQYFSKMAPKNGLSTFCFGSTEKSASKYVLTFELSILVWSISLVNHAV